MGRCSPSPISPFLSYLISYSAHHSSLLVASAWDKVITAYRPATVVLQKTHFKTYLFVLFFYHLPQNFWCSNLLGFLEILYQNKLSPKVIRNCVSSISSLCSLYQIPCDCQYPAIGRFLRSISMTSQFRPTTRRSFWRSNTLSHI